MFKSLTTTIIRNITKIKVNNPTIPIPLSKQLLDERNRLTKLINENEMKNPKPEIMVELAFAYQNNIISSHIKGLQEFIIKAHHHHHHQNDIVNNKQIEVLNEIETQKKQFINKLIKLNFIDWEKVYVKKCKEIPDFDNIRCKELLNKCILENNDYYPAYVALGNYFVEKESSYTQAVNYYEKAIDYNVDAIYNLAIILFEGSPNGEILQNKEKAIELITIGCDKFNDNTCKVWLAERMHEEGNYKKCLSLLDSAAASSPPHPQALFFISRMFLNGDGVSKDIPKGLKFLKAAAVRNHDEALFMLGDMHYHSNEYINQDIDSALEFYKRAADLGHVEALYSVGVIFYNQSKFDDAIRCYEKAAELQHVPSLISLGKMYYDGIGVTKSIETALKYKKMADDIIKDLKN
jgi:TPR repeat protein